MWLRKKHFFCQKSILFTNIISFKSNTIIPTLLQLLDAVFVDGSVFCLKIGFTFSNWFFIWADFLTVEPFFGSANSQESLMARSGLYGGWGSNSKFNSCNFAIVFIDLWHGALSWWDKKFFFCHMRSFLYNFCFQTIMIVLIPEWSGGSMFQPLSHIDAKNLIYYVYTWPNTALNH